MTPQSPVNAPQDRSEVPAPYDQSEDMPLVNAITAVVRDADQRFQKAGGTSRHWVRDWFLPLLNTAGMQIVHGPTLIAPCSASFSSQDAAMTHMRECDICTPNPSDELLTALKGVVRVADRQTAEFAAARAAIANAVGCSGDTAKVDGNDPVEPTNETR